MINIPEFLVYGLINQKLKKSLEKNLSVFVRKDLTFKYPYALQDVWQTKFMYSTIQKME